MYWQRVEKRRHGAEQGGDSRNRLECEHDDILHVRRDLSRLIDKLIVAARAHDQKSNNRAQRGAKLDGHGQNSIGRRSIGQAVLFTFKAGDLRCHGKRDELVDAHQE